MVKILVTGSTGQLGLALNDLASDYKNIIFDFKNSSDLDITDPKSVISCLNEGQYNYCINCAAYTQVDKAESDEVLCFETNAYAPMLLANLCKDLNATLIHISTDYVYHLDLNRPLLESDHCQPQGIYAQSKYEGEGNILACSPQHIIIRTSWLYSSIGNNFVQTMLRLGKTKDSISVVNDQIGAPTYAKDLAHSIMEIIQRLESSDEPNILGGLYNYSNMGQTSWYDFAHEIFSLAQIDIELQPIPSISYPTPAPRPKWSVLDNSKIENTFNVKRRDWKIALKEMIDTNDVA